MTRRRKRRREGINSTPLEVRESRGRVSLDDGHKKQTEEFDISLLELMRNSAKLIRAYRSSPDGER